MRTAIAIAGALLLGIGLLLYGASEWSGEVVRLVTLDEAGVAHETPLWVVEDEGRLWLRAGDPESSWLVRLERHPEVELVRDGVRQRYRAVPVPEPTRRARVNALMAQRYGWGDRVVRFLHEQDATVPVRLEPLPSASAPRPPRSARGVVPDLRRVAPGADQAPPRRAR